MDKQKILKKGICFGMLWLADYMMAQLYRDGNMETIFNGVAYGSRVYFYVLPFFVFACFSLYMHGEFEEYVCGMGVYRLIREGRSRLFVRLAARLFLQLLAIGAIHISGYGCMCYAMIGKIYFGDWRLFVRFLIVNAFVYYFVFFVQMMLELWMSGRIAMYITMVYYLVSLFVGDMLYIADNSLPHLQLFFLPNIAMRVRWEKIGNLLFGPGTEILLLTGIICIIFFAGNFLFRKKDII